MMRANLQAVSKSKLKGWRNNGTLATDAPRRRTGKRNPAHADSVVAYAAEEQAGSISVVCAGVKEKTTPKRGNARAITFRELYHKRKEYAK